MESSLYKGQWIGLYMSGTTVGMYSDLIKMFQERITTRAIPITSNEAAHFQRQH